MKKLLALMLAAVMALSLVACGGGDNTGDTNTPSTGNGDATSTDTPSGGGEDSTPDETKVQEYSLGETISTEDWEITLSQVTFGTNLCKETESDDYMIVDGDYETTFTWGGETYNLSFVAEDGRAFVAVAYTMKYTGKTEVDANNYPEWKVDYNDGYIFEDSPYVDGSLYVKNNGEFEAFDSYTIEPLSPAAEYRDCFDVPIEVKENTDAPVKIIITIDGEDYIYSVR